MTAKHFGILGFPWDGGASLGRPGARYAPKEVREAFGWFKGRIQDEQVYHVESRKNYNVNADQILDYGDIDIVAYDEQQTIQNAYQSTKEIIEKDGFPFIIGGDHSISYPIIKPLHDTCSGQVGIIHFDAHADLRDDYLGAKLSHACVLRRCHELIGDGRIHQFGIRSGDREEFRFAAAHTDMHPLTLDGLEETVGELERENRAVYLTIDLDCLDPSVFPGTGTPEAGGLSFLQLLTAIRLAARCNIVGADVNELAPMLDPSGVSTATACKVLRELLLAILKK